jgi:hypothetical protein
MDISFCPQYKKKNKMTIKNTLMVCVLIASQTWISCGQKTTHSPIFPATSAKPTTLTGILLYGQYGGQLVNPSMPKQCLVDLGQTPPTATGGSAVLSPDTLLAYLTFADSTDVLIYDTNKLELRQGGHYFVS